MAALEQLRAENRRLRSELRKEHLRAGGLEHVVKSLKDSIAWVANRCDHDPDRGISLYKGKSEHVISFLPAPANSGVYGALGLSPMESIATYEDLTYVARAEVAAAPGVGPQTMAVLDAAMAEHGLEWADAAATEGVSA